MVIKPTTCKCGKPYIDFDNQIGQCPNCSKDSIFAEQQQVILKNLTYMTTDAAFRIVLRMLTEELVARKIQDNATLGSQTPVFKVIAVEQPSEPKFTLTRNQDLLPAPKPVVQRPGLFTRLWLALKG